MESYKEKSTESRREAKHRGLAFLRRVAVRVGASCSARSQWLTLFRGACWVTPLTAAEIVPSLDVAVAPT